MLDSKHAPGPGCSQLGRIRAQTLGLGSFVVGRWSALHDVDIVVHTSYLKLSSALIHFCIGSNMLDCKQVPGPGCSQLWWIRAQTPGLGSCVPGRFSAQRDVIVLKRFAKLT